MKLRKFIKNKYKLLLGITLKLFEAVIEILLPIGMSLIIDRGIKKDNTAIILQICLGMFFLVVVAYVCSMAAQYLAYDVSESYTKALRNEMYHQISLFSPTQFNEYTSSTLINRLTIDAYQSGNGISMSIRSAARAPFLIIGSLIAVYMIHGALAFILFLGMVLLIPILYFILIISMKKFKLIQEKQDVLIKVVKNQLTGMRIIRSFSQQERENTQFNSTNQEIGRKFNSLNVIQLLSSPLTSIFMYTAMVVMLMSAGSYVENNKISVAQVSTLVTYATQLIIALASVMNLVMIYTRSIASNQRIRDLLNEKVNIENYDKLKMPETIHEIKFIDASYTYPRRSKPSIKHINLDIKNGDVIGLTGKTGSGKSTIMQMLAGFFTPESGKILINDINYQQYQSSDIKRKIGYVSQQAKFLKGTIFENITMGNEYITEDIVIEALKKAEAFDFVIKKPGGIHGLVEEKGVNFSGGQRQRLALARAFAHRYDVLILDDSFSALDYLTEFKIREHIIQDYKNKILILISVRKSTLDIAQRIYVLEKGQIESEGSQKELIEKSELYNMLVEG